MKLGKSLLLISLILPLAGCGEQGSNKDIISKKELIHFSYDQINDEKIKDVANDKEYYVDYVFNKKNESKIFKAPSEPLLKQGVSKKSLYMDGFSTFIKVDDYYGPTNKLTVSSWIAPRVFENVFMYDGASVAAGHTRLTSIFDYGDMESGQGFTFGYGRLGLWGLQMNLRNEDGEEFFVGYYDPINSLEMYQWNHITATFDGETGYIALMYNGKVSYSAYIPELVGTEIISADEALYMGANCNPMVEFGVPRQRPAGLIDETRLYHDSLTPKENRELYKEGLDIDGNHPDLPWEEVGLDSSLYEGDRYRQQYHAIPPATWMNEPHSPFYYKGYYHVFYQHNPSGPYWSQIRWAHIVSKDMIHWNYVKDAVVPTKEICPEGVWTGGACIGPDGTPWLAITAGTNTTTWTGQNVAYAHAKDPNDPFLVDWVVEDKVVITQPYEGQGERDQFRDPFVWCDDGVYYMMVSTSIPGAGGSANIYRSTDMRQWEYKGYLFECDYNLYPEQGAHWECVVMLPISTKDGSTTKYILFDCPQYTVDGYIVDCYYWVGTFNKETCRFTPDNPKPQLFDLGVVIFTGQNGYCYLTDEQVEAGITRYEAGRTIIYAIAQGKSAGTAQNIYAGWAHSFAIPLELHLADDKQSVIREPIAELESVVEEELFNYEGEGKSVDQINEMIGDVRGDLLQIDAHIKLDKQSEDFKSGLYVRYNKYSDQALGYEKTGIVIDKNGIYVDRTNSTYLDYVDKRDSYTYNTNANEHDIKILLDRSLLEIYVDGVISFTTRIYPKFSDSDYLKWFDNNGGLTISSMSIKRMGSAYRDEVTPAYYGNTGSIVESGLVN